MTINPMLYPGLYAVYQRAIVGNLQQVTEQKFTVTSDIICNEVAKFFGISVENILSRKRDINTSLPRQMAMFMMRYRLNMKLREIGEYFKRDHSTVVYAISTVESLSAFDKKVRAQMLELQKII